MLKQRPVLFHRIHEWDFDQFIKGCAAEMAHLERRREELENMTDDEFRQQLEDLNVSPLRTRTEDLDSIHLKWYQLLHKDSQMTEEEYAVIKKEADEDCVFMREVLFGGMRSMKIAQGLVESGFWIDLRARCREMSHLPLDSDFAPVLLVDLTKIQSTAELIEAARIIMAPFESFRISLRWIKRNGLDSAKENLKQVVEIAGYLDTMKKAGVISAIS